jgi:hypothetical protein
MSYRLQLRIATVLAGLAVVLAAADIYLFARNQSQQADVSQRQAFINESNGLARLNETLVRTLATVAVNNGNTAIRDILHEQGIDYNVTPNPAPPATAAPAPAPVPSANPAGK